MMHQEIAERWEKQHFQYFCSTLTVGLRYVFQCPQESEIARLQARVSGFERAALSQMQSGKSFIHQPMIEAGHRMLPSGGRVMQPINGHHADQLIPQKMTVIPENAFVNNSVPVDESQGYRQVKAVHGSSAMFDTLQFQNGTGHSNGTDSTVFQGMYMEAVTGQNVSSQNSLKGAVRTLNFDNISESDANMTGQSYRGNNMHMSEFIQQKVPKQIADFPVVHDGE